MKRRTKVGFGASGILVLAVLVGALATRAGGAGSSDEETVAPHRGDLVHRALAVGKLEPDVVVSVKSMLPGVVKARFAEVGEYVRAGAPLLEIQPTPTPLEQAEARRQVELRSLELEYVERELERQESLADRGVVSVQEIDGTRRRHSEARLQVQMAKDRLALLERGRITIAEQELETVIKAPVSGYILEKMVEIGDPIVPLSSYQAGTVLMTMADMSELVFRGTVDEIDVGRLREGMPAEIRIGALPEVELRGVLSQISLQSRQQDNSTVFPIEISLTDTDAVVLRAGYSANAYVIIERREDVLLLPERLVTFEEGRAWVTVATPGGGTERREIEVGLSDAIHVEVVSGLAEDERVPDRVGSPSR